MAEKISVRLSDELYDAIQADNKSEEIRGILRKYYSGAFDQSEGGLRLTNSARAALERSREQLQREMQEELSLSDVVKGLCLSYLRGDL